MMSQSPIRPDNAQLLERIKTASGWCIEQRRKRQGLTQTNLAGEAGITVRWLREIEGGNPKTSIEDHLRCAAVLGLATGYMLILMMFMERDMTFPRELLLDDLASLEERCVECIAEYSLARIARQLRIAPGTARDPGGRLRDGA